MKFAYKVDFVTFLMTMRTIGAITFDEFALIFILLMEVSKHAHV